MGSQDENLVGTQDELSPLSVSTLVVAGNAQIGGDLTVAGDLYEQADSEFLGDLTMGNLTNQGGDITNYSDGAGTVGLLYTAATGLLELNVQGSGAGIELGGDVRLFRASADVLQIPDQVTIDVSGGNGLTITGGGSPHRFAILYDGAIWWGDGVGARDTNLYRSAANLLKTDDSLTVAQELSVGTTDGADAISIARYTTGGADGSDVGVIQPSAAGNGIAIFFHETGVGYHEGLKIAGETGAATFYSSAETDRADGWALLDITPTATVPSIVPNKADPNTGIGWSADTVYLIGGSRTILRAFENATGGNQVFISGRNFEAGGTDDKILDITGTLNDPGAAGGSDEFRAIKVNITETDTTGWDSIWLMDLQVDGVSKFNVDNGGAVTQTGNLTFDKSSATITGENNAGSARQMLQQNNDTLLVGDSNGSITMQDNTTVAQDKGIFFDRSSDASVTYVTFSDETASKFIIGLYDAANNDAFRINATGVGDALLIDQATMAATFGAGATFAGALDLGGNALNGLVGQASITGDATKIILRAGTNQAAQIETHDLAGADTLRMSISGQVDTAVVSWTTVTHTGITLSGTLAVNGQGMTGVADIQMNNGSTIRTSNIDNYEFSIQTRDNGVGLVDVFDFISAADPYARAVLPMVFNPVATASLPATPVEGMFTYDATLDRITYYDGGAWRTLLEREGDTMSGNLDMGGNILQNVNYLQLDEITTPGAVANHGALYTKTDNKPYFQDGAGTEHEITTDQTVTPGAVTYILDNSTAKVIDTQNEWHGAEGFTQLSVTTGIATVSSIRAIFTAMADAGGGEVTITSTAHGLSAGDYVTITGTTNYNAVYEIQSVTTNTFNITATWGVDESGAASTFCRPFAIKLTSADVDGKYKVTATGSFDPASSSNIFEVALFINGTACVCGYSRFTAGLLGTYTESVLDSQLSLQNGDIVWLAIQNQSGTGDVTPKHANFNIHRIGG